jgi:release factor H-coupled RctB family protein
MSSIDTSGQAPATPHLVTGPGVWMESNATEQLAAVAQLRGCVAAVGMPDLHAGRGFPIGAAVATRDIVYPGLVGGDAGCGARLDVTTVARVHPDLLERRLRDAFGAPLLADVDLAALFVAAWHHGARGLATVEGLPDGVRRLAERESAQDPDGLPPSGDPSPYLVEAALALGSIGGGNHFAEVTRVGDVHDAAGASELGLVRGALMVLVHSGSRGLGAALGDRWQRAPLIGDARETYRGELAGACRFAMANRLLLAYRLLSALGALRDHTLRGAIDLVHNDVRDEAVAGAPAWVHRKGVAPAQAGRATVVLGSRGTPSWVMRGTGAATTLASVAHGAGRKMTRGDALSKLRTRYLRRQLGQLPGGARLLCDDSATLYEEHPDAYKAIESVVAALETAGAATRIAALVPVMTVKL